MAGQIVEITNPGRYLKKTYGFLEILDGSSRLGRVPLDDIVTVMVSVPGCSISTVLVDNLCQRNIPLVICGDNYLPSNITIPVSGNSKQFQVMLSQVNLKIPRRKRAWQRVVRVKITNQARVLANIGENHVQLSHLANKVQSGDKMNCEAQAARFYWQKIFGSQFRRRKEESSGINVALNYVYAVVRACTARGIVAAGLHPTLSIHHINPRNALNLVDDLMEPMRPIADYLVWRYRRGDYQVFDQNAKLKMASILNLKIPLFLGEQFVEESPLSLAAVKICKSFATYCKGSENSFLMPGLPEPLYYLELE